LTVALRFMFTFMSTFRSMKVSADVQRSQDHRVGAWTHGGDLAILAI